MSLLRSRFVYLLIIDSCLAMVAWLAAYWLRFNLFFPPLLYIKQAFLMVPMVVFIQLGACWFFGVYRIVLKYISMRGAIRIVKAVFLTTLLLSAGAYSFSVNYQAVPRSVFPIYFMLALLLLVGSRAFYRRSNERYPKTIMNKRVLLIGAGGAAEMIIRELDRNNPEGLFVVGLLDDNPTKQGRELRGIRVLGKVDSLVSIAKEQRVDLILIAIPSANAKQMQYIVDLCESTGIAYRTLPSINDITTGRAMVSAMRDVRLEDLLSRDPIAVDWQELGNSVSNKVVLVTGGGGSIGSELCRQIAKLGPKLLIILDHSEFSLYKIHQELSETAKKLAIEPVLNSVTSKNDVVNLFTTYQPDVVFHAAAYKHVPLLETHVKEAFYNNVVGTRVVAEAAIASNVEKFVLISTDKAVHPTNVMGASKRCAELLCYSLSLNSKTEFITVRFGNVLGSAGSAIPLFKEQIAKGGPITITHPEATRYFMTIPEACALIMQAASIGKNGELFVLDMGDPVKVSYLVEELLKLSKNPDVDDIEVVYIGLRPGEKLHEELFYQEENLLPAKTHKLRHTALTLSNIDRFNEDFAALLLLPLSHSDSITQIREKLFEMIDYTLNTEHRNESLALPIAANLSQKNTNMPVNVSHLEM